VNDTEKLEDRLRRALRDVANLPGPEGNAPNEMASNRRRGHTAFARRHFRILSGVALVAVAAAVVAVAVVYGPRSAPKQTAPVIASSSSVPTSTAPRTLPDGSSLVAHWTQLTASSSGLPSGAQISSVVQFQGRYVAAGSYFPGRGPSTLPICSTDGCNPVVWTSTNGHAWTATWESVAQGSITGEQLIVTSTGLLLFNGDEGTALWHSGDGVTWNKVPLPAAIHALPVIGAVWGHGHVVAIFNNKFAGGPDTAYGESDTVWISPDGVTWHQGILGEAAVLRAVAVTPTGYLIGGETWTTEHPTVWASVNGTHWRATTLSASPGSVTNVASDGTAEVAGNLLGAFWWSKNEAHWTEGNLPEVTPDLVTSPVGFVAGGVDASMSLWSSSTGAAWTSITNQGAPSASTDSLDGLYPDQSGALAVVLTRSQVATGVQGQIQIWGLSFTALNASVVLGPDGLGVVQVGDSQSSAVSTMTRYLGAPTSTTPGDCSARTEVQWQDLSLEFSKGTLAGYRYLKGGLAAVGTEHRPTGSGTPLLTTSTGATLGMSQAQVRPLYPASAFSEEQGGAIVVNRTTNGDRLFLGFFENSPSTPLTEIKGGSPCGDF
jgi:hypothetical protein